MSILNDEGGCVAICDGAKCAALQTRSFWVQTDLSVYWCEQEALAADYTLPQSVNREARHYSFTFFYLQYEKLIARRRSEKLSVSFTMGTIATPNNVTYCTRILPNGRRHGVSGNTLHARTPP
jgi:hypothetical protein